MQRKLVLTSDGSHTLYVEDLNEHYHSTHGAVQESMHVYINAGLMPLTGNDELHILEMGFGTGLNAWLTLTNAPGVKITYTAVEAYPITIEEVKALNYTGWCDDMQLAELFYKLHEAEWEIPVAITENFTIIKRHSKFEALSFNYQAFDLVYFDAFAPSVQPELWDPLIFQYIYGWLKTDGVLVTYCAKGEFKRTLTKLQFKVETLPGPPGKNQITRASKVVPLPKEAGSENNPDLANVILLIDGGITMLGQDD